MRSDAMLGVTPFSNGYPASVSVGFYADWRVGEVFVDLEKRSDPLGLLMRDTAVLLSIALQHGAPLATVESALLKHERGEPASMLGDVVRVVRELADAASGDS